ncbi:MAG TPA: alpha/beta hydrolase-fold protein [Chryseolinea sp.]|nr:alpha/beta hydrolase-fold protein [Chryseolinea sp.]HPM32391.1 alpha/beta hydrolase-fold protein [Chryseolinea sp.]
MKRIFLFLLVITTCTFSEAQLYYSFQKQIKRLYSTSSTEVEKTWQELSDQNQIPLVDEDSVAFLYRGDAKTVSWMGDFNGWGYDKKFKNVGTKIPNTNIWILKTSFSEDARLDYKIVVDESNWILDPANQHQQWSGVGGGSPNSELRMARWKEDPITHPSDAIPHGRVEKDILINSSELGYQVTYSVYLPANYNAKSTEVYPIIYVTDGYEYMHERMGNMITILDNLIHEKKIKPIVAVFIDHREPVNRSNNRRMTELAMNEHYLHFVTNELIPKVEKQFPISKNPADRAIMGTSMGGLAAAYFSFSKPEIFGLAGIQSPAFWFRPEIYTYCDNPDHPPVKTFMTSGMINDTKEGADKMKLILEKNTCRHQYKEVNQGHSWGNWRDLIDDMLIYFFPAN